MNAGPDSRMPRFEDPPVIETVLGVEFAPLEKWDIPHFGLFWNEVKGEFPAFEVKPPLASQIERFERLQEQGVVQVSFKPDPRCWFLADDKRTLIQVQNNRFVFNWKKESVDDKYPRFDQTIRPAFVREWARFRDYVEREALGELVVVQCEVTYINHLEIEKGWHSAADLGRVFPLWSGKTAGSFLPTPENVGFEVWYLLPNHAGRLRFVLRHAVRNSDGAEILQLTVSARGAPRGRDDASLMTWMDMGREWVVRGFTDFTSDAMHKIWKRSQ